MNATTTAHTAAGRAAGLELYGCAVGIQGRVPRLGAAGEDAARAAAEGDAPAGDGERADRRRGGHSCGLASRQRLQAQVQALLAQISSLQGGSSMTNAACKTFTRNHKMGETGGEIMWIQQFLNSRFLLFLPLDLKTA